MKAKLSDQEAIFRDSLFENLRDIINLIPKLNVTGDAQINDICDEMKDLLTDPQAIRENSILRTRKAQEVEDILNKYADIFG
jgi:hypothetical protein